MQELEINGGRTLAIWWLIFWRSMLMAACIGFALGLVLGLVGHAAGWPRNVVAGTSSLLGLMGGFAAILIAIRMALKKRYNGFRIALLAD